MVIVNATANVVAILFSFFAGWLYKHQSHVEPTWQGLRWVNSLYPGSWSLFLAHRKFIRIPRPKVSFVKFYISSFSKSFVIQQANSNKNTHRQVFRYLAKYSFFCIINFFFIILFFLKLYKTLETVFRKSMKQFEVHQEYLATRRIFNFLLIVYLW